MERWTYQTIELDTVETGGILRGQTWSTDRFNVQLNALGMQGWELVGFFYREGHQVTPGSRGTENVFATFKRKV